MISTPSQLRNPAIAALVAVALDKIQPPIIDYRIIGDCLILIAQSELAADFVWDERGSLVELLRGSGIAGIFVDGLDGRNFYKIPILRKKLQLPTDPNKYLTLPEGLSLFDLVCIGRVRAKLWLIATGEGYPVFINDPGFFRVWFYPIEESPAYFVAQGVLAGNVPGEWQETGEWKVFQLREFTLVAPE